MAAANKTYDFKQVTVSFGGRILTGFAEGDAITVEPNSDSWTTQVGADGETSRSKSNNRSARVTLRLMQTSDSNAILNEFLQLDILKNSGKAPLIIKDNNGTSLHATEEAWIAREPTSGWGMEAAEREWVLDCGTMINNYGGNL